MFFYSSSHFPFSSPTSSPSSSSSSSSISSSASARARLAQGYALSSPHFSLVNILSRLSSIIFIPKEWLRPRSGFYSHSSLWNISVSDEVTICLHISGGAFWSGNADQDYEFLSTGAHEKHMKPNCGHLAYSPQDDKLKFKCCSVFYRGLCGSTDILWKNSLFLPISLPFLFSSISCSLCLIAHSDSDLSCQTFQGPKFST